MPEYDPVNEDAVDWAEMPLLMTVLPRRKIHAWWILLNLILP